MFFRKKAILMIHGFVGGCYDFDNFHNDLQTYKKFDVFTFTLPAHNQFIVNNVKYKEWLDESINQIEFLINNGYKEIYLIGHSMGGVIAAKLATIYPRYVKKLVLVAPAFRYFYFKNGKIDLKNVSETIKNIRTIFKGEDAETVVSRIAKTPIPTIIEFMKLVKNSQECVKYINCPTITIHGKNDLVVPTEGTEYVYNNIKSKTNILYNIENLNHNCFVNKKIVKDIIKDFLIKHPNNRKEIIEI